MSKQITCTKCQGTGQVGLNGPMLRTYAKLRQQRKPISGSDLARKLGDREATVCNRLRELESFGLVSGVVDGRRVLWEAV